VPETGAVEAPGLLAIRTTRVPKTGSTKGTRYNDFTTPGTVKTLEESVTMSMNPEYVVAAAGAARTAAAMAAIRMAAVLELKNLRVSGSRRIKEKP